MSYLRSVQPVSRIISTYGSKPVEVLCNDGSYYICKYARFKPASRLFNEYIAARFLKIWNISTPDIAFVSVEPVHIIGSLSPADFQKPCFGSKVVKESQDVNRFTDAKKLNHIEFLKIALFDIWLCNEDRTHNNFNLLIGAAENTNSYQLYAIDHEYCFNTDTLERELTVIGFDETIINTDLFKSLNTINNSSQWAVNKLTEEFNEYVKQCGNVLDDILTNTPLDWGIDIAARKEHLTRKVFTAEWITTCIAAFTSYIQQVSTA